MRANKYDGVCAECRVEVSSGDGLLIGVAGSRRTICTDCTPVVLSTASTGAMPARGVTAISFRSSSATGGKAAPTTV